MCQSLVEPCWLPVFDLTPLMSLYHSQLLAFLSFQGVESTIPSSIRGIVAVATDSNLAARVEVTQAPPLQALSPRVSFNVINRWGAKIERTEK